ncbi:MAG: MoxR family ATPase [Acidimicrobiales bacterium]|nr:MoxR family ATPase [Acidimicrobiales bacterium]
MSVQETTTRTFAQMFGALCTNIGQFIRGKDDVVRLVALSMIADGHLLIEDAPGLGKTSLAKSLAASVSGTMGRIQFTPDLLPSDVVGASVWNRETGAFEFRPGAVFNNIVLADEINRASPKTQSALLEAMAERQVTVDGITHRLARPFLVIATQNPIEHQGTYPLPESQLDRFLMRLNMGYPERTAEIEILTSHGASTDEALLENLTPVLTPGEVVAMQSALSGVHVNPGLQGYLVDLATATRRHPMLALGMSPRATLALQRVSQALAAASGRDYVTADDVKALSSYVITHRLVVSADAQLQGVAAKSVLSEILTRVPVPAGGGS